MTPVTRAITRQAIHEWRERGLTMAEAVRYAFCEAWKRERGWFFVWQDDSELPDPDDPDRELPRADMTLWVPPVSPLHGEYEAPDQLGGYDRIITPGFQFDWVPNTDRWERDLSRAGGEMVDSLGAITLPEESTWQIRQYEADSLSGESPRNDAIDFYLAMDGDDKLLLEHYFPALLRPPLAHGQTAGSLQAALSRAKAEEER